MNLTFFNESTGRSDDVVWVGHVRLGMVVRDTNFTDGAKLPNDRYGHVTGFIKNLQGELLLEVKWADALGQTKPAHPANTILFR